MLSIYDLVAITERRAEGKGGGREHGKHGRGGRHCAAKGDNRRTWVWPKSYQRGGMFAMPKVSHPRGWGSGSCCDLHATGRHANTRAHTHHRAPAHRHSTRKLGTCQKGGEDVKASPGPDSQKYAKSGQSTSAAGSVTVPCGNSVAKSTNSQR